MANSEYHYLGDRLTDPALKGATCTAVRRADGKCIRSHTNGNMLVQFDSGRTGTAPADRPERVIVIARLLRKVKKEV